MTAPRSDQSFANFTEFYRTTYGGSLVESREVAVSSAGILHCRQGAGDWSDAPTPDLVISMQRGRRSTGSADLGAGEFRLSAAPGRGIVVPAHSHTRIHRDRPHELLAFGISYGALKALAPAALPTDGDFGRIHAEEFSDPFVLALVERLWAESQARNPHGRLFAEGALVTIAASLLRLSGRRAAKPVNKGGLAPWQVRRATEALKGLMHENTSLAMLAEDVGLSPFHFSRAFKQSLGVPPHRYRTRLRLEKACHLLQTTNASMTDIALEVGYESSQALARVFGQEMGVTPTAWRRTRRQ